jgi:DNA replication and repair protein RecF
VTCITGPNGSGKTNFLDAVYYLCYTKSYFSASVQQSVLHGTEGFRVEGVMERQGRTDTIACKWKQGKKEISANGVPYERLSEHIGRYAAVMVAPDDIEIVNDGSELRRRFMDAILGQCDPQYLEALLQYQRVLAQRNAWLKQYTQQVAEGGTLEYYNMELTRSGTYIAACRKVFVQAFIPLLERYYALLSGGKERASLVYESDLLQTGMADLLERSLSLDFRYQRTLKGIHKDDLVLLLDDKPVKNFGSQGQKKSFLFSLKLAQYEYLSRQLGIQPILLLDDIFEKLDQQRMESLLRIINDPLFGQVLLTDTHEERVRRAFGERDDIAFLDLS